MKPIFNEKIAEKMNLWVREQCTIHHGKVNKCGYHK